MIYSRATESMLNNAMVIFMVALAATYAPAVLDYFDIHPSNFFIVLIKVFSQAYIFAILLVYNCLFRMMRQSKKQSLTTKEVVDINLPFNAFGLATFILVWSIFPGQASGEFTLTLLLFNLFIQAASIYFLPHFYASMAKRNGSMITFILFFASGLVFVLDKFGAEKGITLIGGATFGLCVVIVYFYILSANRALGEAERELSPNGWTY